MPDNEHRRSGIGNLQFNLSEFAGAFGDVGTLIPYVIAYTAFVKVEPTGMLFAFGIALIACGFIFRTPMPVQPMKAIGVTAIAASQAAQFAPVTPAIVYAAALVTGITWLLLAATGLVERIARLMGPPVVLGMVLGLGLSFMVEGVKMLVVEWPIGFALLFGTLLLLANRRVPAMLVLLLIGAALVLWRSPEALTQFAHVPTGMHWPSFQAGSITWSDVVAGTLLLALPQLPLTLGNACIATRAEHNRMFPQLPVSERKLAYSHGFINLGGSLIGGVPVCHGAGGLAGHVRFGARTGGATIIMGTLLIAIALLYGPSVAQLLELFPRVVLGVILLIAGVELAFAPFREHVAPSEALVLLITAGVSMWNVGVGFLVGSLLHWLVKRGWVRF